MAPPRRRSAVVGVAGGHGRRGGAQLLRWTFPGRKKRGGVGGERGNAGWERRAGATAFAALFRGLRGDVSRGGSALCPTRPLRGATAGGSRPLGEAGGGPPRESGLPQASPRRPGRCLRRWRFVPAGSGRAGESRGGVAPRPVWRCRRSP